MNVNIETNHPAFDVMTRAFIEVPQVQRLKTKFKDSMKLKDDVRRLTEGGRGDVYATIFGDPLRALQRLLGHKHYETTFIYLDILSADDFVIDEALRIFEDTLGSEEDYLDLIR